MGRVYRKKKTEEEPIDVVFVLGTGSNWNNNELRFSLRSIEKNLCGYRNIYVVGEDPGFTQGIIHIAHPDEIGPHNADGNIIHKVLRVCKEPGLSRRFVYMNDDEYFLRPIQAKDIYPIHKGNLNSFSDKWYAYNYWRSRLKRTRDHLNARGLPALHFDHHAPMIFDKVKFPKIVKQFDYASDVGLTIKSLYGNVVHPDAKPNEWEKVRIFHHKTVVQINKLLENALYLTINDFGLNNSMKYWLTKTFPNPSKYEAIPVQDKVVEVANWLASDQDYDKGVRVFGKYGRHFNLSKMMLMRKTPSLEKKLRLKLENLIKDI